MAKVPAKAVVGRRLRDQVYDLVKDDLKAGTFEPHQRFYEFELAEKYGVSRTPVREALVQLVREGLLVSQERGYTVPVDTAKKFADRLEVHLLIDPRIAYYAAARGDGNAVKGLRKLYEKACKAHQSGIFINYVAAIYDYRIAIREMCENEQLRRCALLIEDQFLATRNELYKKASSREWDVKLHGQLLAAIESGDPARAEQVSREHLLTIQRMAIESPDDFPPAEEASVKRRPRQPRLNP